MYMYMYMYNIYIIVHVDEFLFSRKKTNDDSEHDSAAGLADY